MERSSTEIEPASVAASLEHDSGLRQPQTLQSSSLPAPRARIVALSTGIGHPWRAALVAHCCHETALATAGTIDAHPHRSLWFLSTRQKSGSTRQKCRAAIIDVPRRQ